MFGEFGQISMYAVSNIVGALWGREPGRTRRRPVSALTSEVGIEESGSHG
jgi:hypothetical protein